MICFTRLIFSKSKQRNVALSRRELPTKPTVNFGCGWRSVGKSCYEPNSLRAKAPLLSQFKNSFRGERGSQDATLHSWKRGAVPVVNSIRLAWDVESVDPLRDVVSLQNDFWGCRRSVSTAGSTGSRDLGVAPADRRPATGQTWSGAIFGSRQNGPRLGLPSISEIPRCTCDRPTRHRGPVASRWFPMLLALE